MHQGYVYVHSNVLPTFLAISQQEQQQGLMNVDWPPPVMSFIYAHPQINKFWMKNTPSPLDIIFCLNGKVSQICQGEPYKLTAIGSDTKSDLVIELPFGTATLLDIKINHKVGIVSPTQSELKKIIAQKI